MPSWVEHVVWWQLQPLQFTGAPAAAEPGAAEPQVTYRLPQVERWLDHVVELGCSGVALGPVFASETHGYDTTDHLRIDPRLGDADSFDALTHAAHERGLRVLLDGVFHHVGRSHPAFVAVLEQGPSAPTASWFRLRWPDGEWHPGVEPDADVFEGHGALVALDHGEPAVADHVVEVMTHWLGRGADGWRLDAAYAVPTSFWAQVLPRVRAAHPDVYVVGEVIHGDYPQLVAESGMDAVTQYELWKAIWSSLAEGNLFELAHALTRHDEFLATFVPLTFVGNHDVTRIASRLDDLGRLPHALVVLFTTGGTPSVYAGDEQGFRGVKEDRAGGDDAVRPAFPAGPGQLSPLGAGTQALHQQLIGLRRRHPWLHRARTTGAHLTNTQFVYETAGDGGRLLVALSLDDAPATLPAAGATEVLAGEATVRRAGSDRADVELPPRGWAVLALR